jgi:hypothetical protein
MTTDGNIPNFLQWRAGKLGCRIDVYDPEEAQEGDYGPYMLRDAESGHDIWPCGLPLDAINDALDCLEREHALPPEKAAEAWVHFSRR